MTPVQWTISIAAVLTALALWLMLPRASARFAGRAIGAVAGIVALGLFASLGLRFEAWPTQALFCILAGVTLIAAGAAVTLRSPVYCAVWFALSLLGTAGLFLFQGAQFLAAATIIVYAGAILVTFLFVLMLAQSTGRAYYDRVSWEPLVSAVTGAVLVGILTMALAHIDFTAKPARAASNVPGNILSDDHVAYLGEVLFSRYLVAVEVGGTLLLAALVGTIAMVGHERPPTEADRLREQRQQSPRETAENGREPLDKRKEPIHG